MDVDLPLKTDVIPSGVDCKEENEVVDNKDEIPESKEEDAIDEAWKSDDFDLPPSDDEENYFSEPPPHVIVELYQKLDEGNILDLEWTCLGRRTPDEDGEKMDVEEVVPNDQEEKVDQPVEEDPTFDFDMDAVIENKVTPRRIPGFEPKGSGSAKKRVAKMDKVLNDIRRFSKINEEMEKTGDDALPPLQSDLEVTPQRPLGKFYIRRDLHQ
ncbi:putative proteoglycan 4 isoform X2 [Apostichopus japonicus]|uniref:Putative proteoglycan 4 isoform X2 n=1 Tax=Stichopus japonicus TaxID=307972 RepID=A0A2G8LIE2_STIJA|nr:putative proteoglycan 4 isoform X2 [Apostichopus japonicus]